MIKLLLGTLIWLLTLLVLGIPLAILSIYKWLVILFYSGRRISGGEGRNSTASVNDEGDGDILQPLPVEDSMFGPGSSWDKPIINFGFVLKLQQKNNGNGKGVSINQLREHFSRCFLMDEIEGGRYDKFFSYLVVRGGHCFRASKKRISLEEHILEVALEDERDQDGNRMSIEGYLADWLLTGYEKDKPCWEINLISAAEGSQFLSFKIHHAQADGYSVLHVLDKLTNNTSPYLVKDFPEGALGHLKQLLEGPTNLRKLNGTPPDQNPFRVTPASKHEWMLSFTSLPLDKMKEIRRKHRVHMQSIVLAIISGAMREFLETEKKSKEIPEYVKIGTTSPWPRHPSRNGRVSNQHKMCNSWVPIILSLPLRNPDPISRMKKIEADLISYKESGLAKFTKQVMLPLMWMMPAFILDAVVSGSDPGSAAGLTSLIGGDNYSLLGCKVEKIHPFMAIHDQCPYIPLSCFTFSHSGKMEVSFGAHPSVFKDRKTLNKFCHEMCHKQLDLIVNN